MNSPRITTTPAKEVALELVQAMPGIKIRTLGTDIPPELLTEDADLESGEILEIMMNEGNKAKVIVTTLVGLPHERIQVIEEPTEMSKNLGQSFAQQVRDALGISE